MPQAIKKMQLELLCWVSVALCQLRIWPVCFYNGRSDSTTGAWALRLLSPDVLLAALISFQQMNPSFLLQILVHLLETSGQSPAWKHTWKGPRNTRFAEVGVRVLPAGTAQGCHLPLTHGFCNTAEIAGQCSLEFGCSALCLGICLLKSSIN